MQEITPGIWAKIQGHGPHIVMLHGLNVSHLSWGQEFPNQLAAANYSVVMPDLPGFGISPALENENLALGSARLLIQWLQTLPKPVILVGHSYGGGIAIIIAQLRPDLVEKLILIAPGGCYPSPRAVGYMEWLDEEVAHVSGRIFRWSANLIGNTDGGKKLMSWASGRKPEHTEYWLKDWNAQSTPEAIRGLAAYNIDAASLELEVPVFLAWGEDDKIIFPMFMRRLAKRTNWPYQVYANAGHLLHLDQPQPLVNDILDWLQGIVTKPALAL